MLRLKLRPDPDASLTRALGFRHGMAKADALEAEARDVAGPEGRTAFLGDIAPGPAAFDAEEVAGRATRVIIGILTALVVVGIIPINAQLPDVAVHVVQPPCTGAESSYGRSSSPGHSICRPALWIVTVEVSLRRIQADAITELAFRPGAACILPFSLRRQAESALPHGIQLPDERIHLVPADLLHRQVVSFETRRIIVHDRTPLSLCHLELPKPEPLVDFHGTHWILVFNLGRTHVE